MESNSNSVPPRTGLESAESVGEIGLVVTLGGSSVFAPTSDVLTLTKGSAVEVMIGVGMEAVIMGGEETSGGEAIVEAG